MDVFELIRSDHEKIKEVLSRLQDTDAQAAKTRGKLLRELQEDIVPHMYAEENYFYQLVLDERRETLPLYEAIEEHRMAKKSLSDLDRTGLENPRWPAKLNVLKELIESHIKAEEDQVFRIAHDVIDDQRAMSVGERFQEMKEEAPVTIK
jgi:hemerythrin-like domain-containing protein